jgi:hypothetical protein
MIEKYEEKIKLYINKYNIHKIYIFFLFIIKDLIMTKEYMNEL